MQHTEFQIQKSGENFEAFFDASSRGWMLEILGAGHLQFLGEDDNVACLKCKALRFACKRGKQSDSQVRALTMTAMAAWLSKCAGGQGERIRPALFFLYVWFPVLSQTDSYYLRPRSSQMEMMRDQPFTTAVSRPDSVLPDDNIPNI